MSDFVPMTREELLTGQGRIGGGDPPIVGAPGRYGSDVLRTALAYLDRAEQLEKELASLRAQVREWVCPTCRVVYPDGGDTGRLPRGDCGHFLTPYGSWQLQRAEQELARERERAEKWKAFAMSQHDEAACLLCFEDGLTYPRGDQCAIFRLFNAEVLAAEPSEPVPPGKKEG